MKSIQNKVTEKGIPILRTLAMASALVALAVGLASLLISRGLVARYGPYMFIYSGGPLAAAYAHMLLTIVLGGISVLSTLFFSAEVLWIAWKTQAEGNHGLYSAVCLSIALGGCVMMFASVYPYRQV